MWDILWRKSNDKETAYEIDHCIYDLIVGIAGALNYNRIVAEADQTLEILEENNGKFPDVPPPEKPSEKKKEGRMSSELPYEARYFSVLLDSEGEVLTTDTGKIARIDTSDAVEYAKKVLKSGKERGCLEGYRYVVVNSDSEVRVIFLSQQSWSPPPVFWQYLS